MDNIDRQSKGEEVLNDVHMRCLLAVEQLWAPHLLEKSHQNDLTLIGLLISFYFYISCIFGHCSSFPMGIFNFIKKRDQNHQMNDSMKKTS